jgi:hypothetical protein
VDGLITMGGMRTLAKADEQKAQYLSEGGVLIA